MEHVARTFSDLDDAMIWIGHKDGRCDREVADELNMSISTLRERRAQIIPPNPRVPKSTTPYNPTARQWTPAEIRLLRTLRAGRKTVPMIAQILDRSYSAVQSKLRNQKIRKASPC